MYFNKFGGKYWAIVGPKYSGLLGDTDYRVADYRGTTVHRLLLIDV
jgi:hypothetical protein